MRFASGAGGLRATDLPARAVARGEDEYPASLEHLPDPPERLWVAGRELVGLPPGVAIVGARSPTRYGEEIATGLAADLARAGLAVVSGLARGIDTCAHEGAIENGVTVAVLPGGIDRCYPASNKLLYERIAERGALVAEVPPGTPTHKHRFTHRNRIIAALALAVIVVQAAEKSGALSTARQALEIGREVFAVPGDVRLDVSAGVHELLRDGAAVCASAGDVLDRIAPEMARSAAVTTFVPIPHGMPEPERAILEALGGESMSIDELAVRVLVAGSPLLIAISRLELDGWVGRGPGGRIYRSR